MRSLSKVIPARLACACVISAYLASGVIGCGGESGGNNTSGTLPAEATQANKSMQDFMKTPAKK